MNVRQKGDIALESNPNGVTLGCVQVLVEAIWAGGLFCRIPSWLALQRPTFFFARSPASRALQHLLQRLPMHRKVSATVYTAPKTDGRKAVDEVGRASTHILFVPHFFLILKKYKRKKIDLFFRASAQRLCAPLGASHTTWGYSACAPGPDKQEKKTA